MSTRIERSNQHAQRLLEVLGRFSPEVASQVGFAAADSRIVDLGPDWAGRYAGADREALAALVEADRTETDAFVLQDLEILRHAIEHHLAGLALSQALELPFHDVAETIYLGISVLLDEQTAAERRPAAATRLRRYAGLEPGSRALTLLAEERTRERFAVADLAGPARQQVERTLANTSTYLAGIKTLTRRHPIADCEPSLSLLCAQLARYDEFLRCELLPRARSDFRLPPGLYAHRLRQFGVDLPLPELCNRARVAFREIQNEMQALAPLVARERGLPDRDYRAVLRALKQEQLDADAILPHYRARMVEMDARIREAGLVTLPAYPMRMRLASDAERAAIPSPHLRPPRLVGNRGETGEFVLPVGPAVAPGAPAPEPGDFRFAAASWTLLAHEGRPGHELQFAAMVEAGVSLARAVFAFNSVNVEGWALYAEAEMKPFEPLDGQLVALQHRLMRAARAFLDPGLQDGSLRRSEAARVLRDDVVLSEEMIGQELDRYTFWAPGQATSYFCGYQRWMALRAEVEQRLGPRFDRRRFHDVALAQGLLPPALLREAVLAALDGETSPA